MMSSCLPTSEGSTSLPMLTRYLKSYRMHFGVSSHGKNGAKFLVPMDRFKNWVSGAKHFAELRVCPGAGINKAKWNEYPISTNKTDTHIHKSTDNKHICNRKSSVERAQIKFHFSRTTYPVASQQMFLPPNCQQPKIVVVPIRTLVPVVCRVPARLAGQRRCSFEQKYPPEIRTLCMLGTGGK